MSHNLLEITDLHISFSAPEGRIKAVKGASFRISHGSTVALVGESGSGKSVISQAIMGILPANANIDNGSIVLHEPNSDAVDLAQLCPDCKAYRNLRGGSVSIIFQEPMTSLSPLHTIGNQISEALLLHRNVSTDEALKLTVEMLNLVGFPEPQKSLSVYPFELSGGLRQRAMIAMALVCRPSLLIADEPTTALDVTIQAQILCLIRDLQKKLNMSVLMITHDLGVVANVADEVVVMYQGEIMEFGGIEDIFGNPQHPYLKALLEAVPRFDMTEGERLVPIRDIQPKTSHIMASNSAKEGEPGNPILTVEHISKTYLTRSSSWFRRSNKQTIPAVSDISFEALRGECLGLVGESGCGKTTLSKILMRALKPDRGSIFFHDSRGTRNVLSMENQELLKFRQDMQFIFQDPFASLNPRMQVHDIITEPLQIHNQGSIEKRRELAAELLELVGLDQRHLNRYPHSFSGGQRQRIGIARALALKPQLLICDEPVSALDVSIQAQILNLLKDLQKELGLTYIFISHNLAVVNYIADRIMVMCQGRLVEMAPREQLFNNPIHPYTRGLLKAVPEPSLDHLLDFEHLMSEKRSAPALWDSPFCDDGKQTMHHHDLGEQHWVLAHENAQIGKLAS